MSHPSCCIGESGKTPVNTATHFLRPNDREPLSTCNKSIYCQVDCNSLIYLQHSADQDDSESDFFIDSNQVLVSREWLI